MSGFDGLPDLVVWFWILIRVCWFLVGCGFLVWVVIVLVFGLGLLAGLLVLFVC